VSVPAPLPVDALLPELGSAVATKGAAVLHAPAGAGKTTRVPPALAEGRTDHVVVLEPRRVAARAAARRIAEERAWELGREVGWWIRFERRFRPETRVLFATEGVLLRWLDRDPFLDGVGTLVFDEFHERSLTADLSLALAQRIRSEARPDLRLVVMSATLEIEPVAAFLGGAPVVRSEGRLFPVDRRLLERTDDRPLEIQVAAAVRRALSEIDGDLLVFLPGRREIERCASALGSLARSQQLDLAPLYGSLPIELQDAALRAGARRRVVLATNVAETSVTVEGVRAVIDSGWARQARFDPATGLDRLEVIRISRAAAEQRAGRAGREGPGLCLRLWTSADDLALRPVELPEVHRLDLTGAVLSLASFGEPDARGFDWFEAPETVRLDRAVRELRDLGALDADGLTQLGRRLARLPLPPRLGRLVLEGETRGCSAEAALAAALLSDRDPFAGGDRRDRAGSRSDLADRIEALEPERHARIFDARRQILRALSDDAPAPGAAQKSGDGLLRAVAAAYLDRLCRRRQPGSDRALMVGGKGVRLGRSSTVRDAELFVAVDLDAGSGRSEALVRIASAVEREWLPPRQVETSSELLWDAARERVVARRIDRFDDLVLTERETPIDDPESATRLLAERASSDLVRALGLDRIEPASLLSRLRFAAASCPELGLPPFDEAWLRALLPTLAAGRSSFAELRRLDVAGALLGSLSWQQRRAVDELAPERLEVPSGSRLRVDYTDPARPMLAARIQELFGLDRTPRLANGRVPVLLHLLAPNGRPQQVTDDLASFWTHTYPIVRKELAGRYPKHAWPDDPRTARPQRRPARR